MYNIKTYNKISNIGLDKFDKSMYAYGDDVENPIGAIARSAALHDEQFPNSLLAIARAGAGTNNIPVERCSEEGIVVFNTPGANANAVKELVISGLMLSSRKIPQAIEWAKTLKGKGDEVGKLVEKGKSQFAGPEIKGKTLGVIGLGAIGVLVANAAESLGMKVLGYDPYLSIKSAWNLQPATKNVASLDDIFANSDYITIHVPLTPDTKDTVDAEAIAKMKDGVKILNFARGGLVNDDAVLDGIKGGKVSCYITDFPDDSVIGEEGVIAIPHLGASTPESEENCAEMAALQLIDYIENGNIVNSVNMPAVSMPRADMPRICVMHGNIPNMISIVSGAVSEMGINIENMVNKSRKDMAYTMLDVSSNDETKLNAVAEKIKALDGVQRVRIIK